MQEQDVVLGRLKLLKQAGTHKTPPAKSEIPEVMQLCKDLDAIFIDDEGILCRKICAHHDYLKKDGCKRVDIAGDVTQRLVPNVMHKSLVAVIHKEECRHMGFDRVCQSIWKRFCWTGMVEDRCGNIGLQMAKISSRTTSFKDLTK